MATELTPVKRPRQDDAPMDMSVKSHVTPMEGELGGKGKRRRVQTMRAPSYANEVTRKQFVARTGFRGQGQSRAFSYSKMATKAEAEVLAKLFCKNACLDRGLPVPPRFE